MVKLILAFNTLLTLACVGAFAIAYQAHEVGTAAMVQVQNQMFSFCLASLVWSLLSIVIIHAIVSQNTKA